jgi:hypothetical protein
LKPLRTLFSIPGAHLKVESIGFDIAHVDHPFIAQWLKQHGHLISKLAVGVQVGEDRLKLRDFCQAASACRSIDLTISHYPDQVVDLAGLALVAGPSKLELST